MHSGARKRKNSEIAILRYFFLGQAFWRQSAAKRVGGPRQKQARLPMGKVRDLILSLPEIAALRMNSQRIAALQHS